MMNIFIAINLPILTITSTSIYCSRVFRPFHRWNLNFNLYFNLKMEINLICSACTFQNTPGANACEICFNPIPCLRNSIGQKRKLETGGLECPRCTFLNRNDAEICSACEGVLNFAFNDPVREGFHCTIVVNNDDDSFKENLSFTGDADYVAYDNNIELNCILDNDIDMLYKSSATKGIVELLHTELSRQGKTEFYLCSPLLFISQRTIDVHDSWSCGYRNIQMLCLSLISRVEYRNVLFGGDGKIPNVNAIQRWIEKAWGSGFDEEVVVAARCLYPASISDLSLSSISIPLAMSRIRAVLNLVDVCVAAAHG